MQIGYLISMVGLILDISGGYLLVQSLIHHSPRKIYLESDSVLPFNSSTFQAGVTSAVEAKFAAPLLIVGFLGQFTGNYVETLSNSLTVSLRLVIAIIVITLVVVVGMYLMCSLRKRWWMKYSRLFFMTHFQIHMLHKNPLWPEQPSVIRELSFVDELERLPDEDYISYLRRSRAFLQNKLKLGEIHIF